VVETDPSYWEPNLTSDRGQFVVTEWTPVAGDEELAARTVREKALQRAVESVVRDLLGDPSRYGEAENEIQRLFVGQFQKYVAAHEVIERRLFDGQRKLGLKVRVDVDRERLQGDLQAERIAATTAARVILITRKPAEGASVSEDAQAHLDDMGEHLSGEMSRRGFEPRLWKDVRREMRELLQAQDWAEQVEFIEQFVLDSDWRSPDDERYELPLILLRTQGRYLVGYRFLELGRVGLALNATMRADLYDLLNGASLGYWTHSDRTPIGDRTLIEARQELVNKAVDALTTKVAAELTDHLAREQRDLKDYTFIFEGYDDYALERIETLMIGIVSEDCESENDGERLTVDARIARQPVPIRNEVARNLKRLGLESRPARRRGTTMTFVKKAD
jgi:hypothetical protein